MERDISEKQIRELYIQAHRLFDGSKSGTALGKIRLEELDRLYGTDMQKALYALDDILKEVYLAGVKRSLGQDTNSLEQSMARGYNPIPPELWTKYQKIRTEVRGQ